MFSQISLWVGVSVFAHTQPHRYLRNHDRLVGPKYLNYIFVVVSQPVVITILL